MQDVHVSLELDRTWRPEGCLSSRRCCQHSPPSQAGHRSPACIVRPTAQAPTEELFCFFREVFCSTLLSPLFGLGMGHVVYKSARAAVTKSHRPGACNEGSFFSHSSGGSKSKIQLSARFVLSEGHDGRSCSRTHPLACKWLSPPCVFKGHPSVRLCPDFLLLPDFSHFGSVPTETTLF